MIVKTDGSNLRVRQVQAKPNPVSISYKPAGSSSQKLKKALTSNGIRTHTKGRKTCSRGSTLIDENSSSTSLTHLLESALPLPVYRFTPTNGSLEDFTGTPLFHCMPLFNLCISDIVSQILVNKQGGTENFSPSLIFNLEKPCQTTLDSYFLHP